MAVLVLETKTVCLGSGEGSFRCHFGTYGTPALLTRMARFVTDPMDSVPQCLNNYGLYYNV